MLVRIQYAIIVVLTIALLLSWAVPREIFFQPREYPQAMSVWTPERGIEFLEWARDCHQYFIDHPEYQTERTGDTKRNRKLVSEYNQVINLLKSSPIYRE